MLTLYLLTILSFIFTIGNKAQFKNELIISITFWEKTSHNEPDSLTFSTNSRELMNRINERIDYSNADFIGWHEFYDIFYSDEAGNFNIDGNCISIEANFDIRSPYHGGLNISEVQLNYANGSKEFANMVTSYNAIGDNAWFDSIMNAADSKLETTTWMGNTYNSPEKLRVTIGLKSIAYLMNRRH